MKSALQQEAPSLLGGGAAYFSRVFKA